MKKLICIITVIAVLCLSSCGNFVTDPSTQGNNQILGGAIDVEVYVGGAPADQKDGIFDQNTWEPGMVAIETVTLKNTGSLAFNYSLGLSANDAAAKMIEYLRVVVIENYDPNMTREDALALFENGNDTDFASFVERGSLFPNDSKDVTIAVYLPADSASSLTQNDVAGCKFDVSVTTTQMVAEDDGFNDYDPSADAFGQEYDQNAVYNQ